MYTHTPPLAFFKISGRCTSTSLGLWAWLLMLSQLSVQKLGVFVNLAFGSFSLWVSPSTAERTNKDLHLHRRGGIEGGGHSFVEPCTHSLTFIHSFIHPSIHSRTHAFTHSLIQIHVSMFICVCMCIYTYCTYMCIHVFIYIYILFNGPLGFV